MNIRFVLLGLLLFTFFSCHLSKIPSTVSATEKKDCLFDPGGGECLIKAVKDDDYQTYARFYYDQMNNLISFSDSQFDTAFVIYNPQKCLTEKIRFYTYDQSGTYSKFFYNDNNTLKSVHSFDQSNNQQLSNRNFFYKENGELSHDLTEDLIYSEEKKNEYIYQDGNIVKIQHFLIEQGIKNLEATYLYEYDNQKNPYYHKRMPRRGRGFTEEAAYTLSKNNITTRIRRSAEGTESIIQKEFVYNPQGYPLIEKVGTTTFTYEYYCLK